MKVPSISQLHEVFGQWPESVAEVSFGRMMSLDRWPEGEVLLTTTVAGRNATVGLQPQAGRLSVEIGTPNPVIMVAFVGVDRVEARLSDGGIRALWFTIKGQRDEQTFILRTSPEIDFRSI